MVQNVAARTRQKLYRKIDFILVGNFCVFFAFRNSHETGSKRGDNSSEIVPKIDFIVVGNFCVFCVQK